ncbi:hypothetical protein BTJ49_05695 [Oleiagrimonas sp. MCCC 1A03011]|nr:hypothetical protein BTJ49_05695 [Oleiagrimonas sp. MCCC 1A03011]
MKKLAILQSNYLPWKGFFDLIAGVDEVVIFDCVQYTKQDWRNRNQIKTQSGLTWLTIPVKSGAHDRPIDEVEIADTKAVRKHWNLIQNSYGKAPCFDSVKSIYQPILQSAKAGQLLTHLNVELLKKTCDFLGINTAFSDSRDFEIVDDKNMRLIEICRQAGANHYLVGPAAKSYIDEELFARHGIDVEWMDYDGYPEYEQSHPPFTHYVSIVDLIAHTGVQAPNHMLRTRTELAQ